VKTTEDRVDRFVSRVSKVCKPVTVLSVTVVTTCRLLNKPITNLNGVFSRKHVTLVSELFTNLNTPRFRKTLNSQVHRVLAYKRKWRSKICS
jgi:hypothetical protein